MPNVPTTIDTTAQLRTTIILSLAPAQQIAVLEALSIPAMIQSSSMLAHHLTPLTPAQQIALVDALAENLPLAPHQDTIPMKNQMK